MRSTDRRKNLHSACKSAVPRRWLWSLWRPTGRAWPLWGRRRISHLEHCCKPSCRKICFRGPHSAKQLGTVWWPGGGGSISTLLSCFCRGSSSHRGRLSHFSRPSRGPLCSLSSFMTSSSFCFLIFPFLSPFPFPFFQGQRVVSNPGCLTSCQFYRSYRHHNGLTPWFNSNWWPGCTSDSSQFCWWVLSQRCAWWQPLRWVNLHFLRICWSWWGTKE